MPGKHSGQGPSSNDTKRMLCTELDVTRRTFYRHVDPEDNPRLDGQKLMDGQNPATKFG